MTKFILDSGDPQEYKEASELFSSHNRSLWGSTTNPSLIAKKIATEQTKLTLNDAFSLQKEIVMNILNNVESAVSAEVYADTTTTANEMIEQGREIASWDERVVVKLPTTLEGLKARTQLRIDGITVNNTLVFSEQQIFAISLHEHLVMPQITKKSKWPSFISPFVGRLDDIGESGLTLVYNGMKAKSYFPETLWMLEASIRTPKDIENGIKIGTELMTAPLKTYKEWLTGSQIQMDPFTPTHPEWKVPDELFSISSLDEFFTAILENRLDITHPLTDKGIEKFVADWQAILS